MVKAKDYFDRVYEVVAKIPSGKVTSFGAIARYLGLKSGARMVGWACNSALSSEWGYLPFHRVLNQQGLLTGRHHFPGDVMRERLIDEGVEFVDEFQVNMKKHFWDPSEECTG